MTNKFYIVDNNSKFGTLVGIKEPIMITNRISVQVGRSVLNFELNNSLNWWWLHPYKANKIVASQSLIVDFKIVAKYYPIEFQKYISIL